MTIPARIAYLRSLARKSTNDGQLAEALTEALDMIRDDQAANVQAALDVARSYGGIDGEHHKAWVIDQMVRALTGERYDAWVREQMDGEDGPHTYEWPEGVAP